LTDGIVTVDIFSMDGDVLSGTTAAILSSAFRPTQFADRWQASVEHQEARLVTSAGLLLRVG